MNGWTFGAEHEWADWDTSRSIPPALATRCNDDYTMVNSTAIANDPKLISYRFGGELNTMPTVNIDEQCSTMRLLRTLLNPTVNYRSNLHPHIRVPGLRLCLPELKRVQRAIHEHLPAQLELQWPRAKALVLKPGPYRFVSEQEAAELFRARLRRRNVSRATFLSPTRLQWQLSAETVDDFFAREVPATKADGKPLWHAQPRVCINLRQLLQTDTIEFRHFPGTLETSELRAAFSFCRDFLQAALEGTALPSILDYNLSKVSQVFDPDLEWGWRRTNHGSQLGRVVVEANIRAIETRNREVGL